MNADITYPELLVYISAYRASGAGKGLFFANSVASSTSFLTSFSISYFVFIKGERERKQSKRGGEKGYDICL